MLLIVIVLLRINKTKSKSNPVSGSAASAHLESGGFFRSHAGVPHPDIQVFYM